MSADNGIYILETKDRYKNDGNGSFINMWDEGITAYRVAHAQGIDNLQWYEENEPYNTGCFLDNIWGGCKVFYSEAEALAAANELAKEYYFLEYGICHIRRPQYKFPGL